MVAERIEQRLALSACAVATWYQAGISPDNQLASAETENRPAGARHHHSIGAARPKAGLASEARNR